MFFPARTLSANRYDQVNETFSDRYETHINKLIQEVFKGNP
jgi:hypothetical protein